MAILQDIDWSELVTVDLIVGLAIVLSFAIGALIALRVVVFIVRRILRRRTTAQVTMLVTKSISYAGIVVIVSIVLLEMGVNLTPLLGAAGIVGLAVGIASQTSLSNMISGLFLVSEKPFSVGDVIRTGDTAGIVESIDLLSVKIRTFDNLFIRVPNEKLAESQLTNVTRFPIRRFDIRLVVPFRTDLSRVSELLLDIARQNPNCLQEPAPLFVPDTFLEYGVQILFGVWFVKTDFLKVKGEVYSAILTRFAEEGIRFAVPERRLSSGTEGDDSLAVDARIAAPKDEDSSDGESAGTSEP
jgi:small-conductance mechanosensitive channel